MRRFTALLLLVPWLSSCVSDLFYDTEVRLQLQNRTPWTVRDLAVVGSDGKTQLLLEQPVLPDSRSRVETSGWPGRFQLQIEVGESCGTGDSTCYRVYPLGEVEFEGGSVLLRLDTAGGHIRLQVR